MGSRQTITTGLISLTLYGYTGVGPQKAWFKR
jgi:hypothetical protein